MRILRFGVLVALLCALAADALPPPRETAAAPRAAGPTRPRALTLHGPGDVNGDTLVDVRDVFYLINYLFANGPAPMGPPDVNGDGRVDVADVFYLVNFLFAGGAAPLPDTQAPSLYYTDPYYTAPDVPRNAIGRLEFSELMDTSSLNADNIRLLDVVHQQFVACVVEPEPNGRRVRLTPVEPLAGGRTYAFVLDFPKITDLAGNPVDPDSGAYIDDHGRIPFTVGFDADVTPPFVTGAFPSQGATGLPTNPAFVVSFSEVVGDIGLENSFTIDGVHAQYAVQIETEKTARVTFATTFAPNAEHTLVVNGLRDLAGNVQTVPWTLHFTTGPSPDNVVPTYTWNVPSESGVPADFRPRLYFSEPILPGSVYFFWTNPHVRFDVLLDETRTAATLVPRTPYLPTRYTIYFFALDGGGNSAGGRSFHFTVSSAPASPLPPPGLSPPTGSQGMPVNAHIQVVASVDRQSLSGITLRSGATPVPFTLGYDLTLTPLSPLSPSTTYTLDVDGLVDTWGRAYPAASSTFTTRASSAPDLAAPAVVSTVPPDGASNVEPAAPISITFSEPIDPLAATLTPTYTSLLGLASWPGTVQAAGSTLTFTPTVPFPSGTGLTVTAANVRDLAANAAPTTTFFFTTSGTPDESPPAITGVDVVRDPSCGWVDLHLSKPIASIPAGTCSPTLAIVFYGGGSSGGGTCSNVTRLSSLTLRVRCAQPAGLAAAALTSAITDKDGHPADPTALFFFDGGPPWPTTGETIYRPEWQATNIPATTPILVFAGADFDPAKLPGAVVVTADGDRVAGSLSSSGRTILFTPDAPLPAGALVEVFVTSALGTNLYPSPSWFRVSPSPTGPALVLDATPAAAAGVPTNAVLRVRFSRPLSPPSVNAASVTLTANGTAVNGTASLVAPDTVAFAPSHPLAPSVAHTLAIAGVEDLDGSPAAPFARPFTTAAGPDADGPTATLVSPDDGGTAPTNTIVAVAFGERLDPLSVNDVAATLSDEVGPVAARVVAQGNHLELVPLLPLAPGALHHVSVAGVTDEAGNPAPPFASVFTTTGGVDVTPTSAAEGYNGLPPNAPMEVVSSRPLAAARLTFQDLGISPPVPGSLSFSADRRVVRFTPSGGWPPSSTYSVSSGDYDEQYRFVTALRTLGDQPATNWGVPGSIVVGTVPQSSSPPTLVSSNPTDGAAGVARRLQMLVQFAEPLSADAAGCATLEGPTGLVEIDTRAGGSYVTVTPSLPLLANGAYTLTLAGLKSLVGTSQASPVTITFTTGPNLY